MLRLLRIRNLVLVEEAEVLFEAGFNVLSGETGAGKSAVTAALALALGARTDSKLLRKGAKKGRVDAIFDIHESSRVWTLLEEAGVGHDSTESLLISRELSAPGKSRSFINSQPAHVQLLRNLAPLLVDMAGQHANQQLRQQGAHREALDLFGDLTAVRQRFCDAYDQQLELQQALAELVRKEAEHLRELDRCRREVEEIDKVAPMEGEDDELFAEYTALVKGQEQVNELSGINGVLSDSSHSVIAQLQGQKGAIETLAGKREGMDETVKLYKQALAELEEVAYELRSLQAKIPYDPHRMQAVNDRLSSITRLKRKYGQTVADVDVYRDKAAERMAFLENLDSHREELERDLEDATAACEEAATQLSAERRAAAARLERALTDQLHLLNMPKAQLEIDVLEQPRTRSGDESVEFLLLPNPGEERVPVATHISGGELARVLLSLKLVLAGKEGVSTMVFDEIDANIGGQTATCIGERLKELGAIHQVLCITHFPQVAEKADCHLRIAKGDVDGRTCTRVETVKGKARSEELARMAGA